MIYVICNPTAGNGRSLNIGKKISEALTQKGLAHEFFLTEHPGHATELAQNAAAAGIETVIAIGGDGTVVEAAGGLYGSKTALGIIPAGTGNDFIKTINTPKEIDAALNACLALPPKRTDVVRLNDRIFLNEIGTGFDVMVLDYALRAKKFCRGLLPYLYGVLCTVFHFQSVHITYALDDGDPITSDVLVVGAGNGRFIGGGIPIAPEAVPDDGLLDVVVIRGMKRLRMLSVLPGLLKGKILRFKETTFTRARKLSLSGSGLLLNIDGEITPIDHAEVEVLPGALLIHRP